MKIKYLIVLILIIIMLFIIASYIFRYHVKSSEIYIIDSENLIQDGGFENFNGTVGDCCMKDKNSSMVFASKSLDAYEGNFSLNLTSYYQCACINKEVINFSNLDIYLLSFYYKGYNPRFCNWVGGNNKCRPENKFDSNQTWNKYQIITNFTNQSESDLIHFYADSSGDPVTNLYDDLQVHRLDPISWQEVLDMESQNQDFLANAPELVENNSYIILTKSDNIVKGERISDIKDGNAYYLISGTPEITLKFPVTEVIILVIMIVIVIRLLFKRSEEEIHESISRDLRRDVEKAIKFHGR